MRKFSLIVLIFSAGFVVVVGVASYNILGVFPLAARSHYLVFDSLMVALSKRGHNVTMYDQFPKPNPLPNYRQVNIKECFAPQYGMTVEGMYSYKARPLTQMGDSLTPLMPADLDILNCQPLLDLRNSTQRYDLLITETFHNDFTSLFGHALNVPVIVFHSTIPFPWMSNHAGLPENPSYIRQLCLGHGPVPMDFWQRLHNVHQYLYSLYFYKVHSEGRYDRVAAEFFGSEAPRIGEAIRNASLLLLNTHYSVNDPRPIVPNVVEVGGINVEPAKPLPQDIEKFINESTHGVVYFSMGSLLRTESFPEEKRKAFLNAFAKLPQRVLWKWEGDILPGKTDNIMTMKWMPQRDIIAHPNVKLFVTHGGLLSMNEAVYEGVPMLGLPIFADQMNNLKTLEVYGAGEILYYDNISEEVIDKKLSKMLNNPKYKENAVSLSEKFKDRPMSPMDTAIYWTEYVIKHKGAHHLKTAAVNMPWHQYLLLDVIAFLVLVLLITLYVVYFALRLSYSIFKPPSKVKTH